MNFRRKIAAALAAVMAFGSVSMINLQANNYETGNTQRGVAGTWIDHVNNNRLVDQRANLGGGIASGVDFVLTGPNLVPAVGGSERHQITLTLTNGIWNYGAIGINSNANRQPLATDHAASLSSMPIPWNTGAQGFFWDPLAVAPPTGPDAAVVRGWAYWVDEHSDTPAWPLPGAGLPASYDIVFSGTSNTAYIVDTATRVAWFRSEWVQENPIHLSHPDAWQPIWGGASTQLPLANRTTWEARLAAMQYGVGPAPGFAPIAGAQNWLDMIATQAPGANTTYEDLVIIPVTQPGGANQAAARVLVQGANPEVNPFVVHGEILLTAHRAEASGFVRVEGALGDPGIVATPDAMVALMGRPVIPAPVAAPALPPDPTVTLPTTYDMSIHGWVHTNYIDLIADAPHFATNSLNLVSRGYALQASGDPMDAAATSLADRIIINQATATLATTPWINQTDTDLIREWTWTGTNAEDEIQGQFVTFEADWNTQVNATVSTATIPGAGTRMTPGGTAVTSALPATQVFWPVQIGATNNLVSDWALIPFEFTGVQAQVGNPAAFFGGNSSGVAVVDAITAAAESYDFPVVGADIPMVGSANMIRPVSSAGLWNYVGTTIPAAPAAIVVTGGTTLPWGTAGNAIHHAINTNIPVPGGTTTPPPAVLPSIGNIGAQTATRLTRIEFTGRETGAGLLNEIPFRLEFQGSNYMVISWSRADALSFNTNAAGNMLRVPLAIQATSNDEISLNVVQRTGDTLTPAQVGTTPQSVTGTGRGVQMTKVGGVNIGHSSVLIQDLRISEQGTGFNSTGVITLTLPYDYVWARNHTGANQLRINGFGRMGNFTDNFTFTETNLTGFNTASSAVPNLAGTSGTPFIFRSEHPDTGQSRLHIVMNGLPMVGGATAGWLQFNNLMVEHRNPRNPVWGTDIEVTLSNSTGGGFRATAADAGLHHHNPDNNAPNGASRIIAPAAVEVFSLVNRGLRLEHTPNAQGEMTEIVAGRVYTNRFANSTNMLAQSFDHFDGLAARVRLSENVPGSALWRDIVLTLTDADGDLLETAKIAGVRFNSSQLGTPGVTNLRNGFNDWVLYHNIVPEGTNLNRIISGAGDQAGDVMVIFSEDGHSVTLRNLRATDDDLGRWQLDMDFLLSVDVNSDADVYMTVEQVGGALAAFDFDFVYPSPTIQLAEVRQVLAIESEVTNIPHRHQSVDVADITIRELEVGALVRDRQIQLSISEFGVASTRQNFGFNPIATGDIEATGALNVHVQPMVLGSNTINAVVQSQSTGTAPSALTFSNLDLFVDQAIPVGTYGVIARGTAILDNESITMNAGSTGPHTGINNNPANAGFRRYGFGGLEFTPYANVTMPGAYGTGGGVQVDPLVATVTATQNSAIVVIDGQTVTMTNQHGQQTPMFHDNGTNFFPMRGIAQVYGSEDAISWIFVTAGGQRTVEWAPGVEVEVTVSLGGRIIVFTTGSTTFTVNGIANTMPAGQTPRNVGGTVFIPFAALGHALGVDVSWEGYGASQQFFFNQPARGTIVTLGGAAAPATDVIDVDNGNGNGNGNGYENGNGNGYENGNGYDNGDDE
ncbi:MAG: copper amine oxidase N-terminal domain-containing protein [Defluviitaleaceae bacterium]|nr:copper amine oxidase N-terminal domain-containing protein [Defluviitaleaceae bacterium]